MIGSFLGALKLFLIFAATEVKHKKVNYGDWIL